MSIENNTTLTPQEEIIQKYESEIEKLKAQNPDATTPVSFRMPNKLLIRLMEASIKRIRLKKSKDRGDVVNQAVKHALDESIMFIS